MDRYWGLFLIDSDQPGSWQSHMAQKIAGKPSEAISRGMHPSGNLRCK
jgi:hypothetical protein